MKFNLIFSNVVNGSENLEFEIVMPFATILGTPELTKRYYTKEENYYTNSGEDVIILDMVDNIYQFNATDSDVNFIFSLINLLENLDCELKYELEDVREATTDDIKRAKEILEI